MSKNMTSEKRTEYFENLFNKFYNDNCQNENLTPIQGGYKIKCTIDGYNITLHGNEDVTIKTPYNHGSSKDGIVFIGKINKKIQVVFEYDYNTLEVIE